MFGFLEWAKSAPLPKTESVRVTGNRNARRSVCLGCRVMFPDVFVLRDHQTSPGAPQECRPIFDEEYR